MDAHCPPIHNHKHAKYLYIVQSNYLTKANLSTKYCPSHFYVLCDAQHGTDVFVQNEETDPANNCILVNKKLAKFVGVLIPLNEWADGVNCEEVVLPKEE
jgi:hypothetical protein